MTNKSESFFLMESIEEFRKSSGDLIETKWNGLLDIIGDNEFYLNVFGTTTYIALVYWGMSSLYLFMDITRKPAFLRKYKIQPDANDPLTWESFTKAAKRVLFNQFVLGIPLGYLTYCNKMKKEHPGVREIPSLERFVIDVIVCFLCREVGFYYTHRLIHHRLLYKRFHKRHHEYTAPYAVMAIDCHPLEHIISNMLPAGAGLAIMNSHLITGWAYFTLTIFQVLNNHSGYHFPFFPSPELHDFHHLKFTECFGNLGILDWFHGTDKNFRKTTYGERHMLLTGLKSAREWFPDDEKKEN